MLDQKFAFFRLICKKKIEAQKIMFEAIKCGARN